eukprot:g26379.t1
MSESAPPLTLYAVVPSGRGHCKELELTAKPAEHGMDIKKKIEQACNIPVDDMELFIKNPSEGSTNKWLKDDASLESEQIEDCAVITVGVHGTGSGQSHVDEDELPQTAVENSIAAKGDTSYYFAHSRKMDVPEEHRIVSGGSPQKLGEVEALSEPVPKKTLASDDQPSRPERAILNYAWGDEQAAVKVYISADAEPEALAAAGDGNAGEVEDTTHLALAIPNGLNKSTRADSKPFPDQVEYIEFRDSLMNEPPLYEWLKNSVVRQLKRGQNVQALRQRNAEYIGVKVAMAILIIILVLSYVELLTEDTSLSWGFERLNAYVKLTIGAPEFNSTIPMAIRRQVITWGKQNEWGRPDRPLLYLDLQRQVYCNSLRPNGVSCSSPLSETTLWQQRKTLNEVDQDVSASPYRTSDLLLLRYPEAALQDVDISAEELENQTEAVALFLNRVDTQASARDSIFTTCWKLSITRLQLAATTNADDENQPATSEIRLLRRRFNGMKTAIRSWGKYVPWPVVQLMMRKDAEANIEVSERQVTMFFSDIASFTTIEMSKIVDQHGGIVVEFIGDAILCIYGAPVVNDKHATVAVMAAAEMLAAMTGINQWLTRRDLPKIAIRCGIHTGEVLVGNMGMQYRIKYGIVGDECSMPGRLEELNKTYGTQLLVSESTHSDMEIDGFVSRPIDA